MKKIIALLLALCMMVGIFAGCGSQGDTVETTASQETTAVAESETAAAELDSGETTVPKYNVIRLTHLLSAEFYIWKDCLTNTLPFKSFPFYIVVLKYGCKV